MLLVIPQAACIARRIIINRVAARRSSLVCIILIPFLLALLPILAKPLLSLILRMDPPRSTVPQCSAILGQNKCSLLVLTVDRPELVNFGEAMAKSISTEQKSVALGATRKSFASDAKEVVFVPNQNDFDKILIDYKSTIVMSVKFSVNNQSIVESTWTNHYPKFDPKIITTRLHIYSRRHSHSLPDMVHLPFGLLLPDLLWFVPDIVAVFKMVWPFACLLIIFPIGILLTAKDIMGEREQRFERFLKANGMRYAAWVLGTCGGLLSVTFTAFYFVLLAQSLTGSYWNELASLPVWLSIFTTVSLAILSLLLLFRSIGGLFGYILAVFGVTSGAIVTVALSLFDIALNSDLMYVYMYDKFTSAKGEFNTPLLFVHVGKVLLFALRFLLWPLRLPALILMSVGARAVDPNALLMGRFKVDQVGWSHLLNPETTLSMAHASIAYYINLHLPVSQMKSANLQALKASIQSQLEFMADLVERVSMNLFGECMLWLSSILLIFLFTWYVQEVSDSDSPYYGNLLFFADLDFWMLPEETSIDPKDSLIVNLPSGKSVMMEGCVVLESCSEQDRLALMGSSLMPSMSFGKIPLHPSFLSDLRSTNLELDKWPSDFACKHAIKFMCYLWGSTFRDFWSTAEEHFLGFEQTFHTPVGDLSSDEKAVLSILLASTGPSRAIVLHEPMKDVVEKDKVLGYLQTLSKSRGIVIVLDGLADESIQKLASAITPENSA